jgi:predicted NAD-dependent protein-ADP-ribosyltransferase YbiA (DUF1768 family)
MQSDRLFYHSKSSDKPAGAGVNEYVNNKEKYTELNKIKDWRKILSNFYVSSFEYKGKKWQTVEHAFQSQKISLADKEKADWFSLDSKHLIGQGDGLIARKNRKLVILTKDQLDIWDEVKFDIMQQIMIAKFQNELPKKVLLLTNDAELWHAAAREKPSRIYELENVRKIIYTTV